MADREFAVAWVDAWRDLGGTVRPAVGSCYPPPADINPEELAAMISVGRPIPEFQINRAGLPKFGCEPHLRISNASEWTGALRALEHLATVMPRGIAAILEVVSYEGSSSPTPHKP